MTANRIGTEKRGSHSLSFTGKSQIVGPGGVLINRAASQREALYVTEIDPAQSQNKNITILNDLIADRRPEYYQDLMK